MMKLMHLADLHLGKKHDAVELQADQADVLRQILALAQAERPDAALICGDVYDRAIPPAEAVTLFDGFLTALSGITKVLLIPGNHDSAERLGFAAELLEKQGVYIGTGLSRVAEPVTIGDTDFFLLPYLHPAKARELTGRDDLHTMDAAVRAMLACAPVNPGRRRVLLAHLFVTSGGTLPERSDSEVSPVGGLEDVDVSAFDGFDYVALGHLHGAQRMGRDTVRYAGSPLPYSFSEQRQHKSVPVVTLGEETRVELHPLHPLHAMREVRGLLSELLTAERDPLPHTDYIHAMLTDPTPQQDARARLEAVYPNLLKVSYAAPPVRVDALTMEELTRRRGRDDLQLFAEFFEEKLKRPLDKRERALVAETLEGAGRDER